MLSEPTVYSLYCGLVLTGLLQLDEIETFTANCEQVVTRPVKSTTGSKLVAFQAAYYLDYGQKRAGFVSSILTGVISFRDTMLQLYTQLRVKKRLIRPHCVFGHLVQEKLSS